jgi:hypothetical protein
MIGYFILIAMCPVLAVLPSWLLRLHERRIAVPN